MGLRPHRASSVVGRDTSSQGGTQGTLSRMAGNPETRGWGESLGQGHRSGAAVISRILIWEIARGRVS